MDGMGNINKILPDHSTPIPIFKMHLPWLVDFGVGDKDCERLRRDINVPVNKPLEAKDAQDKVALMDREAPRELMIFSEEARIMGFSRGPTAGEGPLNVFGKGLGTSQNGSWSHGNSDGWTWKS